MQKEPHFIFSVIVADEESAVFNGLLECVAEIIQLNLIHIKSVTEFFEWCNGQQIPDLVLLDSGFGEGKAYALAAFIKMKFEPQPVVVMMPYFGMTPITMAVLSGCDEVICKPTHLEDLMALLNKWNDIIVVKN